MKNKCGNRNPEPASSFCCKTTGNQCTAAADRGTCVTLGGQVQEGKTCGVGGTCQNVPGNQVTWWGSCPSESGSCPGTSLDTTDDLISCVDETAQHVAGELLCLQFPGGWSCSDRVERPITMEVM